MLTPRQQQIVELVARGQSSKAIAHQLGIAPRTVEDHIAEAAKRIPGGGRQRHKITVWFWTGEEAA